MAFRSKQKELLRQGSISPYPGGVIPEEHHIILQDIQKQKVERKKKNRQRPTR